MHTVRHSVKPWKPAVQFSRSFQGRSQQLWPGPSLCLMLSRWQPCHARKTCNTTAVKPEVCTHRPAWPPAVKPFSIYQNNQTHQESLTRSSKAANHDGVWTICSQSVSARSCHTKKHRHTCLESIKVHGLKHEIPRTLDRNQPCLQGLESCCNHQQGCSAVDQLGSCLPLPPNTPGNDPRPHHDMQCPCCRCWRDYRCRRLLWLLLP